MSVQFCFALLALFSLTAASDPDCEELIKPVEDKSQVHGKWIYRIGTSSNEEALRGIKAVSSSWIEVSPILGTEDTILRWADKMDGKCIYGDVNTSYTGNYSTATFNFNNTEHNHAGNYLKTYPDCIVWSDNSVSRHSNGEIQKARNIYFFTKSEKLDDAHVEGFKKQAACLGFSGDFHFGDITDLCPEEEKAATDVKEKEQ
ncbi:hypothetical protein PAMP_022436 [Pampus punctatissimus]